MLDLRSKPPETGASTRNPSASSFDFFAFSIFYSGDPVLLFANWKELKSRAEDILRRAAGRPGHIFNLGHGILPETPVDNVKRVIDFVHTKSARK